MGKHWYSPSWWLIFSLVFQVLSLIVFIIGFATDVWAYRVYPDDTKRVYGLWRFMFHYFESKEYQQLGSLRSDLGNNAYYVTRTGKLFVLRHMNR